ncbi:MAG: L,D-transpeptidase family protein [Spirochaetota bacterium]
MTKVLRKYGAKTDKEWKKYFQKAGIAYPPEKITFLAFKKERRLEVWAHNRKTWKYIRSFRILGASGKSGPKLVEGDRQVPEGMYNIELLNPESSSHLSMKLNYPNSFDQKYAKREKRSKPGGNIFIHGHWVSRGCLAMGDPNIEKLFVLVARSGKNNVRVIIAPRDFRRYRKKFRPHVYKTWVEELYKNIRRELKPFYKTKK